MARWGMTKHGPTCHVNPTKMVAAAVFSVLLMLLAGYSQTQLNVTIMTLHLAQGDACLKHASNSSIPWELKDNHSHDVVTDILRLERPDFADDFRNPCWRVPNNGTIKIRCLPYFLLAGMPKSGTTDLYHSLGQHPQVHLPLIKESHWWARYRYTHKASIESYVELFDKSAELIQRNFSRQDGKPYYPGITGEGSVSTFWDNFQWRSIPQNCNASFVPHVVHPHLIKHMIPNAKIIVIFRNPIDRLYSDYLYFRWENKSKDVFHRRCLDVISAWRTCVERYTPWYCVTNRVVNLTSPVPFRMTLNMYAIYVNEWLKIFPREQMHFIEFREYSSNRTKVLKEVVKFLDLDPFSDTDFINDLPILNQRRVECRQLGPMHNKTRQLLQQFFQPYNEELARLLQDKRFLFT